MERASVNLTGAFCNKKILLLSNCRRNIYNETMRYLMKN